MKYQRQYSTGEAAKLLNISQITVKRWIYSGKIRADKTVAGRYQIPQSELNRLLGRTSITSPRAIIYCRASPGEDVSELLDEQARVLKQYCKEKRYHVAEVLKEISSGLNEKRTMLFKGFKLLEEGQGDIILVQNKDRLTRFGYKYLEELATKLGGRIEVVDKGINRRAAYEIVDDLVSVTTCFTALMHGATGERLRRVREAVMSAVKG